MIPLLAIQNLAGRAGVCSNCPGRQACLAQGVIMKNMRMERNESLRNEV